MADRVQPKIHPVIDQEKPWTAPSVPEVEQHPPPELRRWMIPGIQPLKKRSCCCRCLCWTASLLILLVIIIGVVLGILFLVFHPKIPSYTFDHVTISNYSINPDSSLSGSFIIRFKLYNPNKKIGIYYEEGSNLTAWYTNTKICEGSLPVFYQGHQNTTILDVQLTGEVQDGTTLLEELFQQQQNGSIPLIVDAEVPFKIKLGKLKLMKMKVHLRCNEVLNSMIQNNMFSVKTSSCKLKLLL